MDSFGLFMMLGWPEMERSLGIHCVALLCTLAGKPFVPTDGYLDNL